MQTTSYTSPEITCVGTALELTGGGDWGPYWDNYNHGKYYTYVTSDTPESL